MVAAEYQQLGNLHGRRLLVEIAFVGRSPLPELRQALGHLIERHRVVEGRHGDIPAVDDLGPRIVGIEICVRVESAAGEMPGGRGPDGTRSHARPGAV